LLPDYFKSEHLNKRSQDAEVLYPDQAVYFLIQNSFVIHSYFNLLHKKEAVPKQKWAAFFFLFQDYHNLVFLLLVKKQKGVLRNPFFKIVCDS